MGFEGSLQDLTSFRHVFKAKFLWQTLLSLAVVQTFSTKLVDNLKQTKNEGYITSINAVIVLLLMSYRLF